MTPTLSPSLGGGAGGRRLSSALLLALGLLSSSPAARVRAQDGDALADDFATADAGDDPASWEMTSMDILLRLYDTTRGPEWKERAGWFDPSVPNVCDWFGVECHDDKEGEREGQIKAIDLSENRLRGECPKAVYQLKYLESLTLRDNPNLDVDFDEIEKATALEELILSNTAVKSLKGIGKARSLQTLHLTDCNLDRDIPGELFELTNLRGLFANYAGFTGQIRTEIGYLRQLTELYLYENDLTGTVPTEIGRLSGLKVLALAQNAFEGPIPKELGNLENLEVLAIQREYGKEKGKGLSGPLPAFDNLKSLTEMYFENQNLSGDIPSNFLQSSPKGEMVKVDLMNNDISGEIPPSLGSFDRLTIFLVGNKITSVPTSMCDKDAWMDGLVGNVKAEGQSSPQSPSGCDAILCPFGTYNEYGRALPSEPCKPCSDTLPYMGAWECSNPDAPRDQATILKEFFDDMKGNLWDNMRGWNEDGAEVCNYHGITCDEEGSITEIDLQDNGLQGTPSKDIFTLPKLNKLNLMANAIDFKFDGIDQATNLEYLWLSNTGLSDLTDFDKIANLPLRELRISQNDLEGDIPDAIFDLQETLTYVSISHNKFDSTIPTEIGLLDNLVEFHAYGNKLEGQIPTQVGNIGPQLKMLVLSENDLTGTLPTEIDKLVGLETLSIHQTTKSGNGIRGILHPFENLANLNVLHLNSNDFTGSLPPTLLANSNRLTQKIQINLADNGFTGIVPAAWSRFDNLDIKLVNNRISGIASELCAKGPWQNGRVAEFDCDAILCPSRYFNEFGLQKSADSMCQPCNNAAFSQYYGSTHCEEKAGPTERDILEQFYYSTNGADWDYNDGWMTEPNICEDWYGISCNDQGKVTKIELSDNSLSGTPSTDIFKLEQLRELDLQSNDINFDFDDIDDAEFLHTIYLSDSSLSSLDGIGDAKALKTFHATSCKLTSIPDEFWEVETLERVFLNYNQIGGRLSSEIGNLASLQELYMMHNQMEGQIPASIGMLTKLRILALTENEFDGTLPPELNDLRSIEVLAIQREGGVSENGDGNAVAGSDGSNRPKTKLGITGPLLSLNNLPNLSELYLGSNDLTGTIPYDFLSGVEDKEDNIIIDLVSNQLEGTVPAALTQFDDLTLYVAGNEFEDIAFGLCSKNKWMEGDVEDYGCNGLMCPPGTSSKFGRESDDENPCLECPAATEAPFYGSFECITDDAASWLGERDILITLYDALGGPGWTLDTNWKSDVDMCDWYGIQCVSETEKSVQGIRLPQNQLKGTFPAVVFGLPNLQEINIGGNKGISVDFSGIVDATKLAYLNLDGAGLTSLSGIQAAQNIKLLHVMGNEFGGVFPNEIYQLKNLEVLYLSANDIGAELPQQMTQLANLVYFQCFRCGLSGPIPTFLGSMSKLEYLRLDQNAFTGGLPTELTSMTSLEHLDLSDQRPNNKGGLTGSLFSFAALTKLTELYLNKNAFTGPIPADLVASTPTPTWDIKVDLRENFISGAVPATLGAIPKLSLYLADNSINVTDALPDSICNLEFAKSFGCNGVLCPPGTFNSLGRQTEATGPCATCTLSGEAQYWGSTDCGNDAQEDILEDFYYGTGGPSWDSAEGWTKEANVCDWYGIECDDDRVFVTGITLEDNDLEGTVPPGIYVDLPKLKSLKLKKNKGLVVPFTGIERAKNLEMLSLSELGLTQVDGISKATSLKYLHLTNNNIGSIPEEIYSLSNLQDLYMNYNNIDDSISTKIGKLTSLRNLFLFHNKIKGSIPTEIGNLKELVVLALGENYLDGEMPIQINSLTNLEIIALQREAGETAPGIGGPLSPKTPEEVGRGFKGPLPTFDKLPKLRELYLGSNSFSGEIPNEFLAGVDRAAVIKVDLTMNDLVGPIPDFFKEFEQMRLYASGNKFKELPKSLCIKSNWMGGDVGKIGCNAILCPPNTFNDYGRQTSSEVPCEPCPYTYTAEFYGSIVCLPSHTGQYTDREILRLFYDATGGDTWADKTNWMNDDVSICKWHGVHCLNEDEEWDGTGNGEIVTKIHMASNGLTGTVPPVLFRLSDLSVINIRDNPVDFEFEEIGGATKLTELYLDATKITSVDGIGEARNLEILHLQQNNFGGERISSEIFELDRLQYLYLSESNFGQTLSKNVKKLTNLKEFYCHGNEITGTIPPTFGDLTDLEVLVLSENNFIGTLPEELNDLENLKALFIDSFTKHAVGISGPLLDFRKAKSLTEIYLNANGLTGTVPADLLSGVTDKDQAITVALRSNDLTGTVPLELQRFSKLNIDLAGNQISGIDPALCDMDEWNAGLVGKFQCDAILCPPGTYNLHGRRYNQDTECVPCTGQPSDQSPFFGALTCESEEKKKEKEILKLFYNTCGGSNWKNHDNWMDDAVDICHWYGISCHDGRLVDSILLGSNNVVGTPPKEIFTMTQLKWLWLYSNPINFSFEGIGNAPKLKSLLLDSTGLTSLQGVEDASVLEDLDVRFNNLQGELPSGISKLINLKTFSCSDNNLNGGLPTFTSLKHLERLRMGGNQFSGPLQDYSTNSKLKSVDLSGNNLSGPIPVTFLKNTEKSQDVFVDLSTNQLTGMVPAALDSFEKLTIYLRDNQISAIDPTLCDNEEWNDGDVGSFNCDGILCPQGTYAPETGRASKSGSQCLPCSLSPYFGASKCGPTSTTRSDASVVRSGWILSMAALVVLAFL